MTCDDPAAMKRRHVTLHSDALGADLGVIAYGHYGRPVLAFPSERGHCWDYENQGMIAAIADLIDDGRVKVYCVDTIDGQTWHDASLPLEERARRHGLYEDWIVNHVAPFVHADCGGAREIIVNGPSFGAYHAANLALKRADLFPLAICQSGVYDVSVVGWGERGDALYFNNPADYIAHLQGDHLEWLRTSVSILVICGQGQWEDTTGALESSKRFAAMLAEKGLRHELDLWGHDVPHDWPSWRAQLVHHLPRFC
jgi:esterase/lipase superfamily enzyme